MTMFWLVIGLVAIIGGLYATATWPDLSGQLKFIWRYFYTRLWGRIVMASLLYLTAFGLIFWIVGSKIDFSMKAVYRSRIGMTDVLLV